MMKLTEIEIGAWNQPSGRQTLLTRYYTNPDMRHMVWLNPNEVGTSLVKDNAHQPFKPGIHHLTRP